MDRRSRGPAPVLRPMPPARPPGTTLESSRPLRVPVTPRSWASNASPPGATPSRRPIPTTLLLALVLATAVAPFAQGTSPEKDPTAPTSTTTLFIQGTGTWAGDTPAQLVAYDTEHGDTFLRISAATQRIFCENRHGFIADAVWDEGLETQRRNVTAHTCQLLPDVPGPGDHTVRLDAGDHAVTGVFPATTVSVRVAEQALPPYNITGLVVAIVAIAAVIGCALLYGRWLQERRFRDFLARRLFEETQGRIPAAWPEGEHHEKELYARYVARAKN